MTDLELAERIARAAGRLLLELQTCHLLTDAALGRQGDAMANGFILAALGAHRPGDAVLSEEAKDDPARLGAARVWIVDPLDGTREFSEGRTDWAVHIGLALEGRPAVGAVALPSLGLTFGSQPRELAPPGLPLRMLVSRSRPAPEAVAVAARLGAELVPMGSAGAKAMAILRGEADIYLHTGGQYEWDNCAPVAVALAAGLHASRADGAPLTYNHRNPYLPDLLICRKPLAPRVLAAISEL